MHPMTIRQATLADLERVVPLFDAYRQFYGYPGDADAARQFLRERLEGNESVIFLTLQGSEPIGFTQLYPGFSSLSLARNYLLNDLYVVPDWRRKGIGAGLIQAAVAHARTVGAKSLSLSTARTNTTAQSLYESLGWQYNDHYLYYDYHVLPVTESVSDSGATDVR